MNSGENNPVLVPAPGLVLALVLLAAPGNPLRRTLCPVLMIIVSKWKTLFFSIVEKKDLGGNGSGWKEGKSEIEEGINEGQG